MWRTEEQRDWAAAIALIGGLFAIRLAALVASPLNLGPDEAQYWRWSTDLAFGYYSKPPLIAWAIALTTGLLGDAEWAVRFSAPLLHGVATLLVYDLGRRMAGPKIGWLAVLCYGLAPGVVLASGVISTDTVLLPFWCLALWSLWRLRTEKSWGLAAALGVAIGFGFLAKYAMVYALLGFAVTLTWDGRLRTSLASKYGAVAVAIASVLIAPHLMWSSSSGFSTIAHTADNANWGGAPIQPANALRFLADQMGVFGPVPFLLLVALAASAIRRPRALNEADRFLLAFILPP
ncbi:MAG: glycosyltransferase family 39 protein, partial [Pseudomonadota bacterium]